jgi:hypothetical protein
VEKPSPTSTASPTETATETPTATATETPTGTLTDTPTATETPTNTATPTATETSTNTPTPTPTETSETIGCTYTLGYWKNHPEVWPIEEIVIGGEIYSKDQAIGILGEPPKGDATYILVHQLIPAKLNVLNGADDQDVAKIILEADDWLNQNKLGSDPKGSDHEIGVGLAETLEEFNNGVIGPGMCDDEVDSLPESKETPTATPTNTPTATATPTPTS